MRKPPEILGTKQVCATRLFTIERVDLRFDNGIETSFERIVSTGGAVMTLAITPENELVLIREYQVGLERYELGFPKGRIDPGEEAAVAANRELMEEASFSADTVEPLGQVSVAPAYAGFQTDLYLATDLRHASASGDEPEPLDVVLWPMARIRELLDRDDFTESRARLAVYMLLDRGLSSAGL